MPQARFLTDEEFAEYQRSKILPSAPAPSTTPRTPRFLTDQQFESYKLQTPPRPPKPPPTAVSPYEGIRLGPLTPGKMIGAAAGVLEAIETPARVVTEAIEASPRTEVQWGPTHPMYRTEAVLGEAVRKTAKVGASLFLDPVNLPFLLAGGAGASLVRPAVRLAADALIFVMQEAGAVESLIKVGQALKKGEFDWESAEAAAMQQGFAMLGLAGATRAVKDKVLKATAERETKTRKAIEIQSDLLKLKVKRWAEEKAKAAAMPVPTAPTAIVEPPPKVLPITAKPAPKPTKVFAPQAQPETPAVPIKAKQPKEEPVLKPLVHEALRVIAGYDLDRARVRNAVGFNKFDTDFGNKLANLSTLSDKQFEAAKKLVKKYRNQLPAELTEQLAEIVGKKPTKAESPKAAIPKPEVEKVQPKPETVPQIPEIAEEANRQIAVFKETFDPKVKSLVGTPLEQMGYTPAVVDKALKQGKGLVYNKINKAFTESVQQELPPVIKGARTEDVVLNAMKAIEPQSARGALVYIPQLRESLKERFPDKASFDKAVMQLAEEGKIQLQRHDLPAVLSAAEKNAMIAADMSHPSFKGMPQQYFNTIGKRMEGLVEKPVALQAMQGGGETLGITLQRPTLPLQTSTGVPSTEVISKSQILRDLSKRLDLPIRIGRFREKAYGIFKVRPEVIRTKFANDVATASHEAGHAINKLMYGSRAGRLNWQPFVPFRSELAAIATKPRKGQSTLPEGFAEYMRLFLTDPAEATAKAPKFDAFFKLELQRFPEIKMTLDIAQSQISGWIQQTPEAKVFSNIRIKLTPIERNRWDDFYTHIVDNFSPVRKAVEAMGGKPTTEENAADLAQLFAGWSAKANHFLEHGTFDSQTLAVTGRSLHDIFEPVEGQLDNARVFLVSRRVLEKEAQGKATGIAVQDAKQAIANISNPALHKMAADLHGYTDSLVEYLIKHEVIDIATADRIKAMNRNYVPFARVFEGEAAVGGGKESGTGLYKMAGSERDIIDPLETLIKNTYTIIRIGEWNAVKKAFIEQALTTEGGGKFAEIVPAKLKPTTFSLDQIKSALGKAGADLDQIDLQVVATVFSPVHHMGGPDNILPFFRKGTLEYAQVQPDVYKALETMDRSSSDLFAKLLSVPTQTLRLGATALSPEFVLRNPMRDMWSAFMQSQYGFLPPVDTIRGIFIAIKRPELYWEWVRSGGPHAAMVSLDRSHLQQNLKDLMSNSLGYAVRHPVESLKIFGEFTEAGTRIGEYALARGHYGPVPKVVREMIAGRRLKAESIPTAGLASREVTLDFQRIGASTRAINSIIAFWNAQVQGMDKFARVHKDNPVGATVKGIAGITLPTLLLYSINKDDPKFKDLPWWRRDFFWNIPTAGTPLESLTPFVPLPKPFEWGMIYGSLPERVAEWINQKDPQAFDDMLKNFAEAALPGLIPTAFIPAAEAWANKSLFTGAPIESSYLRKFEKQYRSEYYTSEFSKAAAMTLANLSTQTGVDLRVSPVQIDNAIFGTTAGAGRALLSLTNPILRPFTGSPEPPAATMADYPIARAFAMRYPSRSLKPVQEFYNRLNELTQKKNTATTSKKEPVRFGRVIKMTQKERQELNRLNNANARINIWNARIRSVPFSDLSAEEKRAKIDLLELKILAEVKRVMKP